MNNVGSQNASLAVHCSNAMRVWFGAHSVPQPIYNVFCVQDGESGGDSREIVTVDDTWVRHIVCKSKEVASLLSAPRPGFDPTC